MFSALNSDRGSVGIIGGADGPTLNYLMFRLRYLTPIGLTAISLGGALIIAGVFCLLFSNTVGANCSIKTSALSLGVSAMGGAGLCCFLAWLFIAGFGEMSRYPIKYPAIIIGGMVCLALFITLIALYCKQRKSFKSAKGFVIDLLTSILFLPTFFYLFNWVYTLIG